MDDVRIIIQARMTSSRLPGKALLPVGGVPSVPLAALRAKRTGLDTVVATSEMAEDDALAAALEERGVAVARGSLDDVLSRYVLAAEGVPDDGVVIRLTGDNTFPDGNFVEELLRYYRDLGVDYVTSVAPDSLLPYGMCCEVMTARVLREADAQATLSEDRGECVTPWIIREYGKPKTTNMGMEADMSGLRCTLDTQEDYERISRVFARVEDPVNAPWRRLCDILYALEG